MYSIFKNTPISPLKIMTIKVDMSSWLITKSPLVYFFGSIQSQTLWMMSSGKWVRNSTLRNQLFRVLKWRVVLFGSSSSATSNAFRFSFLLISGNTLFMKVSKSSWLFSSFGNTSIRRLEGAFELEFLYLIISLMFWFFSFNSLILS